MTVLDYPLDEWSELWVSQKISGQEEGRLALVLLEFVQNHLAALGKLV